MQARTGYSRSLGWKLKSGSKDRHYCFRASLLLAAFVNARGPKCCTSTCLFLYFPRVPLALFEPHPVVRAKRNNRNETQNEKKGRGRVDTCAGRKKWKSSSTPFFFWPSLKGEILAPFTLYLSPFWLSLSMFSPSLSPAWQNKSFGKEGERENVFRSIMRSVAERRGRWKGKKSVAISISVVSKKTV